MSYYSYFDVECTECCDVNSIEIESRQFTNGVLLAQSTLCDSCHHEIRYDIELVYTVTTY